MSTGKVLIPAVAPAAVPSAATAAGLTGGATQVAGAAASGLATVATAAGIALLAVGAAATAVVVTRGAMTAINKGMASIRKDGEEWLRTGCEADEWHEAVLEVIDRNARIQVLRAATARPRDRVAGPVPDLPGPLNPAGRGLHELRDWCAATDSRLASAERQEAERAATAGMYRLGDLPAGARLKTAAEALAGSPVPAPRNVPPGEGGSGRTAPGQRPEVVESARRILAGLPVDVHPDDRLPVLEATLMAIDSRSEAVAATWLDEANLRAGDATERAEARRADQQEAVRYLTALKLDEISPELFPPGRLAESVAELGRIVAWLDAVVAGDRAFDGELRTRARDAVLQAQDLAELVLTQEMVLAELTRMGYQVRRRRSDGTAMSFDAARADAGDEAIRFEVSAAQIIATMLGTPGHDRVRAWKTNFGALAATLEDHGVRLDLVATEQAGFGEPAAGSSDERIDAATVRTAEEHVAADDEADDDGAVRRPARYLERPR